ncbi:MAG: DUF2344 domain-containing protein [Actinomycetia bacterium]|nr:DUF2344 domain-containing protein [Actinomycetes bacterium]
MSVVPNDRVRIRYRVGGKIRFLSHRDVARVIERAIRRAGVPVAYSQGYSPRPKLQYGLALSTGYESDGEYIEVELDADRVGIRNPEAIASALAECMPKGLDITAGSAVPTGSPSLQDSVESTTWEIHLAAGEPAADVLAQRVGDLLAAEEYGIEIVRKGKQIREDLRPLLRELVVIPPGRSARTVLRAELGTKPRSVRPAELLETLGVTEPLLVRRTHQWIYSDGERREPIGLAQPSKGLNNDRRQQQQDSPDGAPQAEDRRQPAGTQH